MPGAIPAIADLIASSAAAAGVDPALAVAVAQAESSLNQAARGAAGEIGVFQILPSTAPGVNLSDLQTNITTGVQILRNLINQFGDIAQALAAYNCGPGCVANALAAGGSNWLAFVPGSTQAYVARILGSSVSAETASPDAGAPAGDGSGAGGDTSSTWGTWALVAGLAVGTYFLVDFVTD
ncbi:MAG TPA: transglycosylase SLT domain-containing protein [Candidatus Acidoferrales bacterium]|nr:transglycosylase SLT domain-containing protein [Candidatus Acidoferrales bacterium]